MLVRRLGRIGRPTLSRVDQALQISLGLIEL